MQDDPLTTLQKVDWNLPGMEAFDERRREVLTKSIMEGDLVNSIHSLGWALWPTCNRGYYDSAWLRDLATFCDIQNKPWLDEYDAMCEAERIGEEQEQLEFPFME